MSGELKSLPAIDQVVAFGNTSHINTRDPDRFKENIAPYENGEYRWTRLETSLEEMFIDLMRNSARNP